MLSLIQLSGGVLTTWVVISCPVFWATAAFRPDLSPDIIRMLDDLGFLVFNLTYMPTTLQAVATGLAGLAECSAAPVFPRWACYLVIIAGIANLPVTLVPFFLKGPLAWNGWFNFPVPGAAFYIWGVIISIYMLKNARQRRQETATG